MESMLQSWDREREFQDSRARDPDIPKWEYLRVIKAITKKRLHFGFDLHVEGAVSFLTSF